MGGSDLLLLQLLCFVFCLFVCFLYSKQKESSQKKKNAFASGRSDVKKGASGVFFFLLQLIEGKLLVSLAPPFLLSLNGA